MRTSDGDSSFYGKRTFISWRWRSKIKFVQLYVVHTTGISIIVSSANYRYNKIAFVLDSVYQEFFHRFHYVIIQDENYFLE